MKLLSKESLGEGRDRRGKEEEREERRKGKREWQVTIIYLVATKKKFHLNYNLDIYLCHGDIGLKSLNLAISWREKKRADWSLCTSEQQRSSTSNRHTQVLFSGHSKLQAYTACSMAEYTLQALQDWRQELSGNEAGVVWEWGRFNLLCIRIPFFPDSLCTSILWSMNISLCSILCDFSPFRDICRQKRRGRMVTDNLTPLALYCLLIVTEEAG